MAKQDVLDAINATIVPNGAKAINADSLRNLLIMMTENAGEGGSGDGALRIMVPDTTMLGLEILTMGELSPASWATLKSEIEGVEGVDLSVYDAAVNASFAHNASVAQQLLEKAREGKGVSVVLDQTPFLSACIELEFQMDPSFSDIIEETAMLGVQPAGVDFQYMKPTPAGESALGGEDVLCLLIPTGHVNMLENVGIANYPSEVIIQLNLDGSLTFIELEEEQPSSGSGVVTFYATMDGDLSSEYKAKNVETFGSYKEGAVVTICAIANGAVMATFMCTQSSHHTNMISASCVQIVENTPSGIIFLCYEDGSVLIQQ